MEFFTVNRDDYRYDPESDLWIDSNSAIYVKNEFNIKSPVFINVTSDIWIFNSGKAFQINWSEILLPAAIKKGAKIVLRHKLKQCANSYVGKFRNMLLDLSKKIASNIKDFSSMDTSQLLLVMNSLDSTYNKNFFREMYKKMADFNISGANHFRYSKLRQLKLRPSIQPLKEVLNWHSTKGAMTLEEELLLKNAIQSHQIETGSNLTIRLFCWLLMDTIKRSKQIRELKKDCLKIVKHNGVTEYFIEIPFVKYQTGKKCQLWPIKKSLYDEMTIYSNISSIKKLQLRFNRFLVMDDISLNRDGVICGGKMNTYLKKYVAKNLNIVSSRTKEPLHVTSTRIRHSGATRLAFYGVSRDIISEILEHDDPRSCQTYIDAVGSELCPKMDAADRNMNSLFKTLKSAYFNGRIVRELSQKKIITPVFSRQSSTLLYVGSCNKNSVKEGQCKKHPFVECYNGCPHFLAWREGEHVKALQYTEREIIKWKNVSISEKQASTIIEFEQLKKNILFVISSINNSKKKGKTRE